MSATVRSTDYPTGNATGMSFICNKWVYTGSQGYRVVANRDGNGFRVVSYAGSTTRPCYAGPGSLNMTEDDAHALAARLAAPRH